MVLIWLKSWWKTVSYFVVPALFHSYIFGLLEKVFQAFKYWGLSNNTLISYSTRPLKMKVSVDLWIIKVHTLLIKVPFGSLNSFGSSRLTRSTRPTWPTRPTRHTRPTTPTKPTRLTGPAGHTTPTQPIRITQDQDPQDPPDPPGPNGPPDPLIDYFISCQQIALGRFQTSRA